MAGFLKRIKAFFWPSSRSFHARMGELDARMVQLEKSLDGYLALSGLSSNAQLVRIEDHFTRIEQAEQMILSFIKNKNDQELCRVVERIISVSITNQRAFTGFKNMYAGQTLVICGAGPTLNYYKPIDDGAIHIALNRAFLYDMVKFDYIFSCDFRGISHVQDELRSYEGNHCIKFFGTQNDNPVDEIPESFAIACNAIRFDTDSHFSSGKFALDITARSLGNFNSIVFPALQFALYTNPAKIYIVGCDTVATGHFCDRNLEADQIELQKEELMLLLQDNFSIIFDQWTELKKFAAMYYPNTDIISVNPIGLKGLFRDEYSESYLYKHPEFK